MLIDWITGNWEIVMSIVLGGSGIFAWVFRWFENRAAQKETVAKQAMEYITLLSQRVTALEASVAEKAARIDQLEKEIELLERINSVLISQLETAGIKPRLTEAERNRQQRRRGGGF